MHPDSLTYKGAIYRLDHLVPCVSTFQWRGADGVVRDFTIRTRYGDHCYSREIKPPETIGADDVVTGTKPPRVSCPVRHGFTSDLVQMITNLVAKPTTGIALTAAEKNCHVYRFYRTIAGQDRYCVFFTVQKAKNMQAELRELELYVQSAYVRNNAVAVTKRMPFGKVVELAWLGDPLF